jgi:hypothetical protein
MLCAACGLLCRATMALLEAIEAKVSIGLARLGRATIWPTR